MTWETEKSDLNELNEELSAKVNLFVKELGDLRDEV